MVRHFASVAEIVEDVDAAVKFYRDALGLEVESLSDGYALVTIPGVLHFGIWSRKEAAKATYGDAAAAERISLGFTIGFEVDDVESASRRVIGSGGAMEQSAKTEPWNQTTARFLSPSGGLCEIAETPWARRITQEMKAE